MKYRQKAFTLLEMVVVVGILAMLMGSAIPLFNSVLAKTRAESVVQEVLLALQLINQQSVFQQEKQDFVIDFRHQQYWIEKLAPGKHSKRLRFRATDIRTLPENYEFIALYIPDKESVYKRTHGRIFFFPDGTTQDATLILGHRLKGSREYDKIFAIEVRGVDSRVRVLPKEEEYTYAHLL